MPQIFSVPSNQLRNKWGVPQYYALSKINSYSERSRLDFVSLGGLAEFSSGLYIKEYSEVGKPYLRVDNIRSFIFNISNQDIVFVPDDADASVPDRCRTKADDVLISRTGTLGKASLVSSGQQDFIMSQHVTKISPKADKYLCPGFLCLFLNSDLGKMQLQNSGVGATRLELTHSSLSKIKVPLASYEDQIRFDQALHDVLERYYQSIDSLSKLVEKTENILYKANPYPLPPANDGVLSFSIDRSQLKGNLWLPNFFYSRIHTDLALVEDTFDCPSLGDFTQIQRGKGTKISQYASDGIPFIRTSSLVNGSIDPFPDHYADQDTYVTFDQKISDADIVYSIEGKIGVSAMLMESFPVVIKNHIELIKIDRTISPYSHEQLAGWIYLILTSSFGKSQAEMHTVVQSTIPGLASRLREFRIPIASNDESINNKMRNLGLKAYKTSQTLINIMNDLRDLKREFDHYLEKS